MTPIFENDGFDMKLKFRNKFMEAVIKSVYSNQLKRRLNRFVSRNPVHRILKGSSNEEY